MTVRKVALTALPVVAIIVTSRYLAARIRPESGISRFIQHYF